MSGLGAYYGLSYQKDKSALEVPFEKQFTQIFENGSWKRIEDPSQFLFDHKEIKKILLVGPSGSGKSLLLNQLANNSCNPKDCLQPAKIGNEELEKACTAYYFKLKDNEEKDRMVCLVDSVGFGKTFEGANETEIFQSWIENLRLLLKFSHFGYHKIFFVVGFGRINKIENSYVQMLNSLFSNFDKNVSIIFTHGEENINKTKKEILEMNKTSFVFEDQAPEFAKLVLNCKEMIIGDNYSSQNDEEDQLFVETRQKFCKAFKDLVLEKSNTSLITLKTGSVSDVFDYWIPFFFDNVFPSKKTRGDKIKKLSFGESFTYCVFCGKVITLQTLKKMPCKHLCHQQCFNQWKGRCIDCDKEKLKLDNKKESEINEKTPLKENH